MDINLFIWVTNVIVEGGESVLDGVVFDEDFGFGCEDIRNFNGNMAIYTTLEKVLIESELSVIHVAGKGVLWSLKSTNIPAPPFLLSNRVDLSGVIETPVSVHFTSEAKKALEGSGYGFYPILVKGTVGIFNYNGDNPSMIVFPKFESSLDQDYWEPILSEWDLKLGRLERAK